VGFRDGTVLEWLKVTYGVPEAFSLRFFLEEDFLDVFDGMDGVERKKDWEREVEDIEWVW